MLKLILTFSAALAASVAGYAHAALACHVNPVETFFRPLFKWPSIVTVNSGNAKQWAGYTTLNSGTAFVTISTQMVNSDSLIFHNLSVNTTCGSGTNFATGVGSIVSGVSFSIGYVDGQGRAPGGRIMWEIRRTS